MSGVCIVPECGRNTQSLGLCRRHYQVHRRHGDLSRSPDLGLIMARSGEEKARRVCDVEGCGQWHYAGGYCRSHYNKNLVVTETQPCSVEGCGRVRGPGRNGLCFMHSSRLRIHGSVDDTDYTHGTLAERLWRKTLKAGPDECWLWTGAKLESGYGRIDRGGRGSKNLLAHRAAMEVVTGAPVPDHLVVMHSCDNPSCVNPAHLSVGTYEQNSADMIMKGRHKVVAMKGTENAHAKLTDEAVRDIRTSRKPQAALARQYGVSEATVAAVIHGRTWRHVT